MARRFAPRPITRDYLERAALHYLERYAASVEQLRRVLLRRVERAVRAGVSERDAGQRLVDEAVGRLAAGHLLDDRAFALARTRSLHRQGRSRAYIAQALAAKGIDRATAAHAWDALGEGSSDPELEAALAFARRRRLGPYRAPADRAALMTKDLGAFARAGFPSATARRVLGATSPDEVLAELAG